MMRHLPNIRLSRQVAIAAAFVGLAIIAGMRPAMAKTYTMKVACNSIGDAQAQWIKLFASRVEKLSHGQIKASTYPAGQLGTTPRIIEGVQFGSIQAYVVPASNFSGVDKRFSVLGASGWFTTVGQAKRTILDPRFRDRFLKLGARKGLKAIGLFLYGPVSYASRKPIRSPSDFKGKKVRVAASAMESTPIRFLGASADPIPLSEVLPAFSEGTVDAVRLAINLFNNYKYYDVAKYVTATNEAVFVSVGVVSKVWFDKLPKHLQKIILKVGAQLDTQMTDYSARQFKGAAAQWKKHGGMIIHFAKKDQTKFLKTVRAATDKVVSQEPSIQHMYHLLRKVAKSDR